MDKCIELLNVDGVKELCQQLEEAGQRREQIRLSVERSLTTRALSIGPSYPINDVDDFLQFVITLAKAGLCGVSFPIQVLQDMFDVSVIRRCEELFSIVEKSIAVFKMEFFFNGCKNLMLRMCNDLLKRLSRTVNTSFCGRIIVLLAKSLPLNERSGLNLPGHYNTDNITAFETDENKMDIDLPNDEHDDDEDRDEGELREKDLNVTVNYALYVKFWEIQAFFANPNLLNNAEAFKKFESNLNDVLTVFSTFKLERSGSSRQSDDHCSFTPSLPLNGFDVEKCPPNGGECSSSSVDVLNNSAEDANTSLSLKDLELDDDFFAKYLTSQKLFNLQLSDSLFRRYFLVQCLILMNYLGTKPRTKDFTAVQDSFINDVTDRCYALLKETYPHGSHFAESVRRILARERSWIVWKSDGCVSIVEPRLNYKCLAYKKRPADRFNPNTIDLSNAELTRLWNINPNNLAACMEEQRNCVPDLKKFLEDALDEMDPEQQVDEQYRSVNNENYQWMASRFLLNNSDSYLNCITLEVKAPCKPTSKFLENAVYLTALNIPELKERAETIDTQIKALEAEKQAEITRLAEEQKERLNREIAEEAARREAEQKAAAEKEKAEAAEKERNAAIAAAEKLAAEKERKFEEKQRLEKRAEAERMKKEEAERMKKEELAMKARLEQKVENAQRRKAIKKELDDTEVTNPAEKSHHTPTSKENERMRASKDEDKSRPSKEDDKSARKLSSNSRRSTIESTPKNGHQREAEPITPTTPNGDKNSSSKKRKADKADRSQEKSETNSSSRHIKMETNSPPQKTPRRSSSKRN